MARTLAYPTSRTALLPARALKHPSGVFVLWPFRIERELKDGVLHGSENIKSPPRLAIRSEIRV